MKFLIDAQLPPVLKYVFHNHGFEAIHTLDLPNANNTSDADIASLASTKDYVVVTKDKDFYNSFLLKRQPKKLILVTVGNTRIKKLKQIFEDNFEALIQAIEKNNLIIIGNSFLNIPANPQD